MHFGPTSNGTACMCCTILVLPVHMRDVRYDAELATVYKNGAAEVRFVNGGAYMKISTHQVSSHLALCINGHRAPLTPAHIHALALAEESKKRHDAAGSQGGRDGFKATLSIVGKPIGEHTIFQALDATLEIAHRQVTIIQRSAVADMVGGRAPPRPPPLFSWPLLFTANSIIA